MDAEILPSTDSDPAASCFTGRNRLGAADTPLGDSDSAPGHQLRVQARSKGYVFARTDLPPAQALQVAMDWVATGCVIEVVRASCA